jgi:bacterioferritin (cytochrome b1)
MKNWLQSLISDEKEAVQHYSSGIKDANKRGDKGSASLFGHIRSEEVEHRRELEDHAHGEGKFIRGTRGMNG